MHFMAGFMGRDGTARGQMPMQCARDDSFSDFCFSSDFSYITLINGAEPLQALFHSIG